MEKKKVNETNSKGKISTFSEKNEIEKTIDRQTAIVILRACGYSIPNTEKDWKETISELAQFLLRLSNTQRNAIVRPAKRVAKDRVRLFNNGYENIEKCLKNVKEYIPLNIEKSDDMDLLKMYTEFTKEEQAVLREQIGFGIAGQQKAIQRFEKENC